MTARSRPGHLQRHALSDARPAVQCVLRSRHVTNSRSARARSRSPTPNNGTFTYTVNGTIAQTKIHHAGRCSARSRTCAFGGQPNLALAINYQDLWWKPRRIRNRAGASTSPIRANDLRDWFTYDVDGSPLWLLLPTPKTKTAV